MAGPGGWKRGLGAILAVGIRPCSGAILVLVFALAQGLFWAGIAATFVMGLGTAITVATIAVIAVSAKDLAQRLSGGSEDGGALVMRGIEFGAAGLVLLMGVGLLFGSRSLPLHAHERTSLDMGARSEKCHWLPSASLIQ